MTEQPGPAVFLAQAACFPEKCAVHDPIDSLETVLLLSFLKLF